ncbi:Aldo-keto reductase yakc (NADP(+)) [Lasiodiplodia hormozganensis]|uniref:Aldo-keto reductase yakc (NADP(+)) n=1 Tax=Lasiodiplodia hormozganensis TaxID=869390 RepID=A0AA39YL72_9PEZI|nr:Aldo-keto reductase yakc (NADP(+)) [Lasiodiplodia hormozganensis]
MALPTRKLGKNGPEVTGLGLGLMGLSVAYGPAKPDSERMAFLSKAYELGERNWDTADMYGDNEDLLGRWFAANPTARPNIFLATKFANRLHSDGSRSIDSSPEYCKQALAQSLSRLGLPSVDLYYCHRLDGKTPVELTVRAMAELQAAGKFKYIGLSECSAESLRRACKVARIDVVQIEYSPFALDIESEQVGLLRACRELGVAVVAYSPIGRGMLSGTLRSPDDFAEDDFRRMAPRFSPENFPKNLRLVERIEAVARKKGVTATQLTLAWLLRQGPDIIPIPGTTKVERLQENLKALDIQLTDEEDKEIREASENAEVAGSRYPEFFMHACFADTPPLEG